MIRMRIALCLVVAAALVATVEAGGGGQNVAVVVNADSWSSRTVANEYVHLRQVPPANVVTLRLGDLQNFEIVTVDVFRERVLRPVLEALQKRKLVGQIDYVAYSSDVPYAINPLGDWPEGSPKPRRQPISSVTGLTFLYPYVAAKEARRYLSLSANFYYPPPKRTGPRGPAVGAPVSRAFHNRTFWAPGGRAAEAGKGLRFLLSTMLACTSGRGNSVEEALQCLRRARQADGTHPKGTIYFMKNGDVRSRTRQWGFAGAVAALKALGVRGEIVDGRLPGKRKDVAGLVAGSAGVNWPASGSTILPGAICEHLTSFGGVMHQRGGQTCIREFIRYGAAGSAGTVTEPYAIQAKFPSPFVHVHYARGCTLGEAMYQSVAGPFQLLMLGDPLCAPWAKAPEFTVAGLTDGQVVKGTLTARAKFAPTWVGKVGRLAVYLDGRAVKSVRPGGGECKLVLNFASAPDGYHELRVVAEAGDAIEAQRAVVAGVRVANGAKRVTVACAKTSLRWGETAALRAGMPGATRIEIRHGDAVLASADAATLSAKLDTRTLGMGAVRLMAVAVLDAAKGQAGEVRGKPIVLTVQPPAPLPAAAAPRGLTLKPGLLITPVGGKPARVKDLRDVFAAEKAAKVGKGQAFTVAGWFDAKEAGLHQFQIRHPGAAALKVDGREIPIPLMSAKAVWRFVPVALAKGTHRFELSCTPTSRPVLDLRFGLRGAQTLDDKRFRSPLAE